jgi:glycosyltransferase involved in cell wall biosynthesis
MRLLVLSFYYQPDLSAGSFRTTPLVEALRARAPAGTRIEVLTTWPNRYRSYAAGTREHEEQDGLVIRRIRLPAHRSDMLGQTRAFARYAREVLRLTRSGSYDLVFATSSRLMTAALGARIARRHGAPLYLDIRDIFVDTLKDILPGPAAIPARALFGIIERRALGRADRINLVSEGFRPYFAARYPQAHFSWFSNGIDDEFITAAAAIDPARRPATPARVLYAGNIGEGQGLHAILPALAQRLQGRAVFRVIGDGGRADALLAALAAAGVSSVEVLPPVDRERLITEYRAADVLFLHLNAQPAFEKVLPSKLFEYAAMGKPILAGVGGYAAQFVRQEIDNAALFRPCDAADAERAFAALVLADHRRDDFLARFARADLTARLAADVLSVARQPDAR